MPLVEVMSFLDAADDSPHAELDLGIIWSECRPCFFSSRERGGAGSACEVDGNTGGGCDDGDAPGERLPVRLPTAARSLDPSRSRLRSPPTMPSDEMPSPPSAPSTDSQSSSATADPLAAAPASRIARSWRMRWNGQSCTAELRSLAARSVDSSSSRMAGFGGTLC